MQAYRKDRLDMFKILNIWLYNITFSFKVLNALQNAIWFQSLEVVAIFKSENISVVYYNKLLNMRF